MSGGSDLNTQTETTPLQREKIRTWRALAAYWLLGLCNNYGYVVMLTAAHNIIAGIEKDNSVTRSANTTLERASHERECNELSTGAILLADIIPALVVKFSTPFLPFYIHIRVVICVSLAAAGYLLVAFATTESVAIAGVVVTSMSSGLGEVSFLQYSSFYDKNVVSTWSSGTGGAGILGSLSYSGLASFGLKTALLTMLIVPVLQAIAFWVILPSPDSQNSQIVMELQIHDTTEEKKPMETFLYKLRILPGLLKFMIPLGLVYLFEYFINQGLFELVQFDDAFLSKASQYNWLQVDYQLGVFISRSSVNLIHIRKIWIMAVLQLVNVVIFTCEALFYFTPSIWFVFAFTLWEGLLGGGAYVNTFYRISKEVPEDKKQFSLSVTSLSDTIGITLAGIIAMPVHNAICKLPKPERLTF